MGRILPLFIFVGFIVHSMYSSVHEEPVLPDYAPDGALAYIEGLEDSDSEGKSVTLMSNQVVYQDETPRKFEIDYLSIPIDEIDFVRFSGRGAWGMKLAIRSHAGDRIEMDIPHRGTADHFKKELQKLR